MPRSPHHSKPRSLWKCVDRVWIGFNHHGRRGERKKGRDDRRAAREQKKTHEYLYHWYACAQLCARPRARVRLPNINRCRI